MHQVALLCKQGDNVCKDESLRLKLLQSAKQLSMVLEKPVDAVFHTAFLVNIPSIFMYQVRPLTDTS